MKSRLTLGLGEGVGCAVTLHVDLARQEIVRE
jgi:hypothetical protein